MTTPIQQTPDLENSPKEQRANPFVRAVVCGLSVFVLLFSIAAWRDQAIFDAGYYALRFGLHILPAVVLVCFLSRKEAWSFIKATFIILGLSLIFLVSTGIKPFLESGEDAKKHDQALSSFCSEVGTLTTLLESDVEKRQAREISDELEKHFATIQKTAREIDHLPDIYDWHKYQLRKKFNPLLFKAKERFVIALELLNKKNISELVSKQNSDWLMDYIQHLSQ